MKRCAIVGGGISGLAAAYFLQKQSKQIQIDLFEAQDRLGGVIRTDRINDCLIDAGPDSFLTQKKSAVSLCRELGLENSLIGSNDAQRKTYLFHEGKLKPLPDGFMLMVPTRLLPLLTTDLLSWPGKLEALGDLFMQPQEKDGTVADFIEQRFGKEILERIAEPLISGIYGSDVTRLSVQSALPQIWEIQKRGSLIREFLRAVPVGEKPQSLFTTLKDGMETFILALRERCSQVRWRLSSPVERAEKKDGFWRISDEAYEILLIASSQTPEIPTASGKQIRSLLNSIKRNSAIVIALCFEDIRRDGFGWLVPAPERRSVLACTYLNNKFSGRLPENRFLVRLFIGGDYAEEWLDRTDEEICGEATRELKRIAGIDQAPLFYRVYRWNNAMPEYAVGHAEIMENVKSLAKLEGNLFLTNSLFAGVGIPDCISHAEKVAKEIMDFYAL